MNNHNFYLTWDRPFNLRNEQKYEFYNSFSIKRYSPQLCPTELLFSNRRKLSKNICIQLSGFIDEYKHYFRQYYARGLLRISMRGSPLLSSISSKALMMNFINISFN
ncbi:hypothetical protein RF11_08979 [Thelohanellus kitauei]|uniref:Uncharacterized protein n=1 Tax=Thelohanellus kitauei TaxID=669202 RepID=A0A0C2IBU7_THEKT|nr:hypothetical protein RF11_08979 [Thelohanellus kitauei]